MCSLLTILAFNASSLAVPSVPSLFCFFSSFTRCDLFSVFSLDALFNVLHSFFKAISSQSLQNTFSLHKAVFASYFKVLFVFCFWKQVLFSNLSFCTLPNVLGYSLLSVSVEARVVSPFCTAGVLV